MKRNRFLLMEMLKNSSKTRKVFLFLAAVAVCLCMTNEAMAQDIVDYGTTGDCTWAITGTSGDYMLIISDNGAMENYTYDSPSPWYSYQNDIKTLDIQQGVTSIGDYAFYGCPITDVTIPNSVESIGNYAFYSCSDLTSITIGNSVKSIESGAFYGCSDLTAINVDANNPNYSSINGVLFNKLQNELIQCPVGKTGNYTILNSVTAIGSSAFHDCTGLISITIGNSVTSIGWSAFFGCTGLTSVTIPNSVTSLGNYAFYGCTGLTSVTIPNSVTDIGGRAFSDCSGLTSVTIPNSVTSIGYSAFSGCTGLTSVTIPNSVITIGYRAFYDCSSLTSVTNLNPKPQSIDSYTFYSVNINNITLYVPAESVETYKAATVWQDFGTITAYTPLAINTPSTATAIHIYSDPATESFHIAGLTAPTPVTVTDVNGKTVLQQTVNGDESISVGHLPQGIYLVRVNGRTVKTIKN
jgi:hypothetical protein